MNRQEVAALEKKLTAAIDASGVFDDNEEPALVFAALLQVGFQRALARGAPAHLIAREFHARLVGLLGTENRKYRPHLVGGGE